MGPNTREDRWANLTISWANGKKGWYESTTEDEIKGVKFQMQAPSPRVSKSGAEPCPSKEPMKKKNKANLISGTKNLRLELQNKEAAQDRNETG